MFRNVSINVEDMLKLNQDALNVQYSTDQRNKLTSKKTRWQSWNEAASLLLNTQKPSSSCGGYISAKLESMGYLPAKFRASSSIIKLVRSSPFPSDHPPTQG
jgi:hypothetical protein